MKTSTLSQLADIQYGYPFDSKCFKENGKIRIVRIRDIKKPDEATFYNGDYDEEYVIGNGDIIVGMDGEFNCTIWNKGYALLNQRVARITPKSSVSKGYLYYFLKVKLKEEEQKVTCSTVKHLLNTNFRNLEIPFMPLEAQMKVATILEKADMIKQKRQQANQKANRLLQAFFLQMFGDPTTNPKRLREVALESVCTEIIDCPHSTPIYSDSGIPLIRTPNVKKGYLDFNETKFVSKEEHQKRLRRIRPMKGDILFAREATFGNGAIVDSNSEFSVGQRIMLIRPDPSIVKSEFLVWMINSDYVYNQAKQVARGATNPHVNVGDVKKFKLILPPINQQMAFASILGKVNAVTDGQKRSSEKVNELFNSVMSKAFKGELVS